MKGNYLMLKKKSVQVAIISGLVFDILALTFIQFIPNEPLVPKMTIYEYICMLAFLSVLIWKLIVPVGKGKLDRYKLLECVMWVSIVAGIYSILTYGQTVIDSDVATASLLAKSQIDNHSLFPKTWNYANGEIWCLSINLFVLPFVVILKDQVLARLLGSALVVLVAIISVSYVCKKINNRLHLLVIPMMLVIMRGTSEMVLYQVAYTIPFILVCIMPYLFYKACLQCEKINMRYWILSSVFLCLICISGIRNIAEIILPLFCGECAIIYLEIRKQEHVAWNKVWYKLVKVGCSSLFPAGIALFIYKTICMNRNVHDTKMNAVVFAKSIQEVFHNFVRMLENIFLTFGYNGEQKVLTSGGICNVISICVCLLFVFIIPVLQALKIKNEDDFFQFYFSFSIVHNSIMMIMITFFGKTETRYVFTTVFMFVVISSHYVVKYWIAEKNFRKYIWTGMFFLVAMIQSLCVINLSVGWTNRLKERREISKEIQNHGLTKGYATYWNAYSNQLYSNMQITYGGTMIFNNSITLYYWLVDDSAFEQSTERTFLMLDRNEIASLDEKIMQRMLKKADEVFNVKNYTVYVFDYDICVELQ